MREDLLKGSIEPQVHRANAERIWKGREKEKVFPDEYETMQKKCKEDAFLQEDCRGI